MPAYSRSMQILEFFGRRGPPQASLGLVQERHYAIRVKRALINSVIPVRNATDPSISKIPVRTVSRSADSIDVGAGAAVDVGSTAAIDMSAGFAGDVRAGCAGLAAVLAFRVAAWLVGMMASLLSGPTVRAREFVREEMNHAGFVSNAHFCSRRRRASDDGTIKLDRRRRR